MTEPKMPEPPPVKTPQQLEQIRDLRKEMGSLTSEQLPEVVFLHIMNGRDPVILYDSQTGQEVVVQEHYVPTALDLINPDGGFRFVAKKEDAPTYVPNTIKCFLHRDSPERATVDKAGLAGKYCPSENLASVYSKTLHAQHKHKSENAAYQGYLERIGAAAKDEMQRQQLDATLALAGKALGSPVEAKQAAEPQAATDCPEGSCDWKQKSTTKNLAGALAAHGRERHPAGVA